MTIEKIDKWLDDKYGISYTEMVKIKNFLSEENERKENDIKDLTYQLAMEKAEKGEANDSAVWWCNRYKAVQRELEEHKKCKLQQRIEKAVKYIEKEKSNYMRSCDISNATNREGLIISSAVRTCDDTLKILRGNNER